MFHFRPNKQVEFIIQILISSSPIHISAKSATIYTNIIGNMQMSRMDGKPVAKKNIFISIKRTQGENSIINVIMIKQ